MAFDKSKFFGPAAPDTAVVVVPGFGPVTVRALTCEEYDRFEVACVVKGADGEDVYKTDRALLARLSVVDPETGANVFTDDDLPGLRQRLARELNPLAKAALKLCKPAEGDGGK